MSNTRKIFAYLTFPIGMWYAIGVAFRNFLFSIGIKKEICPPTTTIGIGNIACGGTGKTPHSEYLIRLLKDQYKVAYLSRGYRRKTKGLLVATSQSTVEELGDEASMIASKFPEITTIVCEKRMRAINKMMEESNAPDVIILDDAYQHRYVKPTINILLTDYNHPLYEDRILPFGNLREFRSARHRANIIIVTKCPKQFHPIEKNNILLHLNTKPCQKIFYSYLEYGTPIAFDATANNEPIDISHIDHALILSGIANPQPMVDYVKQFSAVTLRQFPDHHNYTAQEIQQIIDQFKQLNGQNNIIITTEKDAARLQHPSIKTLLQNLPVYILPIEIKFHNSPDFDFDNIICSAIRENITFQSRLKKYREKD